MSYIKQTQPSVHTRISPSAHHSSVASVRHTTVPLYRRLLLHSLQADVVLVQCWGQQWYNTHKFRNRLQLLLDSNMMRCEHTCPSQPPVTKWCSLVGDQLAAQTGSLCPTSECVKPPVAGSHSLMCGSAPTTATKQCVSDAEDIATPYTLSEKVKLQATWPRLASHTCNPGRKGCVLPVDWEGVATTQKSLCGAS